jgi:hypothetical protein
VLASFSVSAIPTTVADYQKLHAQLLATYEGIVNPFSGIFVRCHERKNSQIVVPLNCLADLLPGKGTISFRHDDAVAGVMFVEVALAHASVDENQYKATSAIATTPATGEMRDWLKTLTMSDGGKLDIPKFAFRAPAIMTATEYSKRTKRGVSF